VLVVDDSASMAANGTDAAARAAIAALHDGLAAVDEVTVVRSGEPPEVVVGPRRRREQLAAWLSDWRAAQPSHRLQPALDLGRDLAGPLGEVVFVTDRDPGALADDLRVIACGVAAGNAAVTAVQRVTSTGGRDRLLVTVEAFGRTAGGDVVVSDGARERLRVPLSLPADGGDVQFAVPLRADDALLRIELPPDALAIDDVAWLLPEPARVVGVCDQLNAETRERLQLPRVFAALRDWRAVVDADDAQVVLRSRPGAPRDDQLEVVLAADGERLGHRSPFVVDRAHELLRGVALDGVAWQSGSADLPGRVLVASGDKVLISEQWLADARRVHVDVDPSHGNLVRAPDWPILFDNLLAAGREHAPGPSASRLRVGDELRYRGGRGEALRLRAPDGRIVASATSRLAHVARQTGLYDVLGEGDDVLATAAARFVDVRESDLRRAASFDRPPRLATHAASFARVDPAPMRRWLAFLLLLVVLADWWVLGREARR